MSLPPGTRIPIMDTVKAMKQVHDEAYQRGFRMGSCTKELEYARGHHNGYWRGLVEGGVLMGIMGSLVTACALALAWSHLGG